MKIEQRHGWTYVGKDFSTSVPVTAVVPTRDRVFVFFADSHLVLRRRRTLRERILRK